MKKPANPWPKGVSANPGGAPKGTRISTWMARYGEIDPKLWPKENDSLPANARIALARLRHAMTARGLHDTALIQDRTEGSVPQNLDAKIHGPIEIIVKHVYRKPAETAD